MCPSFSVEPGTVNLSEAISSLSKWNCYEDWVDSYRALSTCLAFATKWQLLLILTATCKTVSFLLGPEDN